MIVFHFGQDPVAPPPPPEDPRERRVAQLRPFFLAALFLTISAVAVLASKTVQRAAVRQRENTTMMIGTRVFGANGDDVSVGPNLPSPVSALAPQPPSIQVAPSPGVSPDIGNVICLLRLQGMSEQDIAVLVQQRFPNASGAQLVAAFVRANAVCPPIVAPPAVIVPTTPGRGGALKPFLIVGGILVGILGVALIATKRAA